MCIMVSSHGLIFTQNVLAIIIIVVVITARVGILTREMMALCTSVLFGHLWNLALVDKACRREEYIEGLCLK